MLKLKFGSLTFESDFSIQQSAFRISSERLREVLDEVLDVFDTR